MLAKVLALLLHHVHVAAAALISAKPDTAVRNPAEEAEACSKQATINL